jgi:hypothetical protein
MWLLNPNGGPTRTTPAKAKKKQAAEEHQNIRSRIKAIVI